MSPEDDGSVRGGPAMTADPRHDPDSLTFHQAERVDRTCDRFEAAWQAGERPDIADYLGDTAGPERSALLRELIAADLDWRRRVGECPQPGDYAAASGEGGGAAVGGAGASRYPALKSLPKSTVARLPMLSRLRASHFSVSVRPAPCR